MIKDFIYISALTFTLIAVLFLAIFFPLGVLGGRAKSNYLCRTRGVCDIPWYEAAFLKFSITDNDQNIKFGGK